MRKSIKLTLFKYIAVALILSISLSIIVQGATQRLSEKIQLKYVNTEELYEFQNEYSELFGDMPTIPMVSINDMSTQDRILDGICDFASSWSILIFTFLSIFIALTLFYNQKLKEPFKTLCDSAEKIGKQELNFKISYDSDDELGEICNAFEKMRDNLAKNNISMWNMIIEQKQMRSAFSHDLRTPLSVMKGYIEYLLLFYPEDRIPKEKVTEVLKELAEQTDRISKFADAMKNVNRLEEVKIINEKVEWIRLYKKIDTAFNILSERYGKRYKIESNINSEALYLDCDIFMEILENIVDNAMRFAAQCVKADVLYEAGKLCVRIYDDGQGFSPEGLKKAVTPYYHGQENGEDHYGMGLYICKVLCEKQGGFLQVYNPPNGGACVEFQIRG